MESAEPTTALELDKLRQEVEQKIGRNVLLFQRMEGLLKFLSVYGSVSGYLRELMANHQQRIASIDRQTMGQLAAQFTASVLEGSEAVNRQPEELKDIWFSIDMKLPDDGSFSDELKESLAEVVSERNELIHHLLPRFDLLSLQSAYAAIEYLDRQRDRILPLLAQLKSLALALQDNLKTYVAFMESEVGRTYLDLWYFEGRQVMQLLTDFANEKARPDGWAVVSTAAHFVEQEAPGELATLKGRFGQRTLKGFLLFTGWFDVSEETTPKGGLRVLYRARSEQAWQVVT